MCLDIKFDARECIATKDITCYKLVETTGWGRSPYKTFYMSKRIKLGVMYRSSIEIKRRPFNIEIHRALHSFRTKTDLFDRYPKSTRFRNVHVMKCIIPKGAKYYMGTFNGCRAYASNRLRYDEIVYSWK